MRKRLFVASFILMVAALLSIPAPTAATNCEFSYQYRLTYYCNPDDEACRIGCECSYYNCKGMDLPSYCAY